MNASDTYARRISACRSMLADLSGFLEAHEIRQAVNPNDWGFAGDAGHVEEGLAEIVAFLRPGSVEDVTP
jgi:hypothetical protein